MTSPEDAVTPSRGRLASRLLAGGREPDPRFTLANERTFLAWIRTGLGLGLGLSIDRRAVRAQGGDFEVRNTPGKGCTFVIEVPAAAALSVLSRMGQPAS